jgi:hypothetical protein
MTDACPFHKQSAPAALSSADLEAHRYTTSEFEDLKRDMDALAPAIAWVNDFVKQGNPDLGRTGVVCPFVPESTRQDMLQYFVLNVELAPDLGREANEEDYAAVIEPAVLNLRDQFMANRITDPKVRLLYAYLIVFRGLDLETERASWLIEKIQRRLKPKFVEAGLMIGEFHPFSNALGLRNPDFRPLRSPVPLLSFRNMVEIDFVFLSRKYDPAPLRVHFLTSYLRHMGADLGASARLKAESALEEAHQEILQASSLSSEKEWAALASETERLASAASIRECPHIG